MAEFQNYQYSKQKILLYSNGMGPNIYKKKDYKLSPNHDVNHYGRSYQG